MAKLNDLGQWVLGSVRQVANDRVNAERGEGFQDAADIALRVLTQRIDQLQQKMGQSPYLTTEEQVLLANLIALRTETAGAFDAFWADGTGE